MFTKPSKIIGWTYLFFFILFYYLPYLLDEEFLWEIKEFIEKYFLYSFVFVIGIWIADLCRDSYENFTRNCLSYYCNGNWINEDYKNIYVNRNRNAFIWMFTKIFAILGIIAGIVLMFYVGAYAIDIFKLIETSYMIINLAIVMIGTAIFILVFSFLLIISIALPLLVFLYPIIKVTEKYPLLKISVTWNNFGNMINSYKRAEEFLSNSNKLIEARNLLVEFNKEQSEIFKLGLAEYKKMKN